MQEYCFAVSLLHVVYSEYTERKAFITCECGVIMSSVAFVCVSVYPPVCNDLTFGSLDPES